MLKLGAIILLFGQLGCGFALNKTGDNFQLPDQARSLFVQKSVNITYQPAVNVMVENELKRILAKNSVLSQTEHLADLVLQLTINSASYSNSSQTSSDFDYYQQTFILNAVVNVIDHRSQSGYENSFSARAQYIYDAKYENPEKLELDEGFKQVAKKLAATIVEKINHHF